LLFLSILYDLEKPEWRITAMHPQDRGADIVQGQRQGVVELGLWLWGQWKRLARTIGDFQARALMTVFYFLILGPVAMMTRWRSDPLAMKATTPRGWQNIAKLGKISLEESRRQF
jgi:hypothetical protein